MLKKITSVLCILLGIAVIVLGVQMKTEPADHQVRADSFRYKATDFDLERASFGGDFYTYMYKGSDVIVDVLDEINKSISTVVSAENGIFEAAAANVEATDALIDTVHEVGSLLMIGLGLGILASGLKSVGEAFEKKRPALQTADE